MGAAYDNIPGELKTLRQWVCYRIEERNGIPTKIPYRTDRAGRGNAKTNDPATWHTFEEVIEAAAKPANRFDGIGFVLCQADPYVFIDLDHVVTEQQIEPWAREVVEQIGSYAEFSQSGSGIHIIARAAKPGPRCRTASHPKFEIYADRRLVVFTGKLIAGVAPGIRQAEEAVVTIYRSIFGEDTDNDVPPKETVRNARPNGMSDPVLIRQALSASNGEKFLRLWNGDIGDYNGDRSSADMALCCMLAYWTDKDPVRMDRLFRESGLMRPKWDERHGTQTYGQMTVQRANAKVRQTHSDCAGRRGEKRSRNPSRTASSGNVAHGPDGEPLNDLGNARRLVNKHGEDIRYCHNAAKWFCWDGRRWAMDETGEIFRRAKAVVDDLLKLAVAMRKSAEASSDESALELAKMFERHAVASGNDQRIKAMISQARSEPQVTILADDLDGDPWLFNCSNGTIDLRTGELRPHSRRDLISKLGGIAYSPDAACPVWQRFLSDIFEDDDELIRFVQCAGGYSLTGDTREQVFFILHGCGSNGKSTFIGALRDVLGDYESKTSTDTLIEKNNSNNSNDVAALRGARLVSTIETSAGRRLAEALVKELTGQDAVTARFLYKEFFTFVPVFKLWLACNHVPVIQGQDHGIWRRIRLVPFGVQFREPDEPAGPYKDKALPEKLKAEYEGILAWLVRGCLDWQKNGMPAAKAVRLATGKLQQDMDVLGGFFAECCVFGPRVFVTAKDLYSAYCRWAEDNGEKPLSQRWFGLRLSERGTCESIRTRTGRSWRGIGLRSERPEDPTDGEPEGVNHVNDVPLDSEKSLSCAHTRAIHASQEIASQGAQGSQNAVPGAEDGLDWSNGVAF